jgi:hypothetical protein
MTKKGEGLAPELMPAESRGEVHNTSTPEKGVAAAKGDGKPATTARKPSNASRNLKREARTGPLA